MIKKSCKKKKKKKGGGGYFHIKRETDSVDKIYIFFFFFFTCAAGYISLQLLELRADRGNGPNRHGALQTHFCDCDDPQNWR